MQTLRSSFSDTHHGFPDGLIQHIDRCVTFDDAFLSPIPLRQLMYGGAEKAGQHYDRYTWMVAIRIESK